MIFGFLTESDIKELQEDVDLLKAQMIYKNIEIDNLKKDLEAIQKFCYNIGGEITVLKRKVEELTNRTTDGIPTGDT